MFGWNWPSDSGEEDESVKVCNDGNGDDDKDNDV